MAESQAAKAILKRTPTPKYTDLAQSSHLNRKYNAFFDSLGIA
jgi:hypothetical protein